MSETHEDQIDRVILMSELESKWDISDNDRAALKALLADRGELLGACKLALTYLNYHAGSTLNDGPIREVKAAIRLAEGR